MPGTALDTEWTLSKCSSNERMIWERVFAGGSELAPDLSAPSLPCFYFRELFRNHFWLTDLISI